MSTEPSNWTPISCAAADAIRYSEVTKPYSSKTDLTGEYGQPEVSTTWCIHIEGRGDVLVMRESRWPSPIEGEPDVKPREHYAMSPEAADAGGTAGE